MKKGKGFRKFECGCGWRSSSFGHKRYRDHEKLRVAQAEVQQHLILNPQCVRENTERQFFPKEPLPKSLNVVFE